MLTIHSRRRSERGKGNWFNKNSNLIQAVSTVILVVITAYYAYLNKKLTDIAREQMILDSEPQIVLYSEFYPKLLQVIDTTLSFRIQNLSHSDLTDITLQINFYVHLMDTTNEESFIAYRAFPFFRPDFFIKSLPGKSIDSMRIDFNFFFYELISDSGYFYVQKTLNSSGNWRYLNLRKSFGFMFCIFEFTYYRENDGKEYATN